MSPRAGRIEPAQRALCLVLAVAALGACVGRPPPGASGEDIYLRLCSNCHGENLEGGIGPALGPGSNASDRPDGFLEATIVQGRGRMPSFATTLDEDQLQRLIDYLREQQGR